MLPGELMEYEKMLDRLYLSLPKEALTRERFEMPVVDSFIQGSKTIIKNFSAIMKAARREEQGIYKILTKELATSVSMKEGRLELVGKFQQAQLQSLFNNYFEHYVLCHQCGKPDTKIIDHEGIKQLKCEACGAISPVKPI
jgi:translation initiation factor 2 subunit 2